MTHTQVLSYHVLPLSSLCWTCRAAGTQVASCPWTRCRNLKKAPQVTNGHERLFLNCDWLFGGYQLELQWAPSDGRLILIFNKFHKCSTSPWVSGTTRILHANHRSSGRFPDVNKGWNFKLSRYRKTSRKPSFHLHVSIFLVKSEPFFSCLWDSFWKKKYPKNTFFVEERWTQGHFLSKWKQKIKCQTQTSVTFCLVQQWIICEFLNIVIMHRTQHILTSHILLLNFSFLFSHIKLTTCANQTSLSTELLIDSLLQLDQTALNFKLRSRSPHTDLQDVL